MRRQLRALTIAKTRKQRMGSARFVAAVCLMAACLTGGVTQRLLAQGCKFQSAAGEPYRKVFKFGAPNRGPLLKIVALGDSVVWGDGDGDKHKIVYLVGEAVADHTGRPVEVDSYAHSGARLVSYDPGSEATFPVSVFRHVPLGDLDSERPTTSEQADCAAVKDSNAEIVLLDGCINEVGATQIALGSFPLNPDQTTPAEIRQAVFNYCAAPMKTVLSQVTSEFKRAQVVLLDYFQVVSTKSKPLPMRNGEIGPGQDAWTERQQEQYDSAIDNARKKANKLAANSGGRQINTSSDFLGAWSANSEEFLKDSTSCFKWAIDSVNAGATDSKPRQAPDGDPVCLPFRESGGESKPLYSIVAAPFPENPAYSYGAPDRHLWLMDIPIPFPIPLPPPLFSFFAIPTDERFTPRSWHCSWHFSRGDKDCLVNPIAHPNVKGAQCYSESILSALGFDLNDPDPDCTSR